MNIRFFQKSKATSFIVMLMFLSVSACSSVDNALDTKKGVNYTGNTSVNILKSPKGIVVPEYDMTFALPEGDASLKGQTAVDIRPPDLIK